jgi:hypothetical protein
VMDSRFRGNDVVFTINLFDDLCVP